VLTNRWNSCVTTICFYPVIVLLLFDDKNWFHTIHLKWWIQFNFVTLDDFQRCLWLFIMVVTSLFLCNYNCVSKIISINVETYAIVKQNVVTLFWCAEFNYQSILATFKLVSVVTCHGSTIFYTHLQKKTQIYSVISPMF